MSSFARSGGAGRIAAGLLVVVVAVLAGCATFKGEIPVGVEIPERTYISPRIADGVQDRLTVPISVAAAYQKMVVGGYRFTVEDAAGRTVRTIEDIATPPGAKKRFMFRTPASVRVPERLMWDGRGDDGEYVVDGEYTYGVEAWDGRGNSGKSPRYTVVVDNTPPSLSLSVPYDTFSPDGDGNLDMLPVVQRDATTEDEWLGEFRAASGEVVRTERWAGTPGEFSWDGTDSSGARVPDGAYRYTVSSTDRAGNRASYSAPDIAVDTRPAVITLGVALRSFSPNGDGVRDTTFFLPRTEVADGVTAWSITVSDEAGAARRTLGGTAGVPERVEFDGRDDGGRVLPDGPYTATLRVSYRNGSSPQAASPRLVVDTVSPRGRVRVDYLVFSPDGDGNRDTISIEQDTSEEDLWEGTFGDGGGKAVATRFWQGKAETFVWDGRNDQGAVLPDGTYSYTLRSTDASGNSVVESVKAITLDARPTPVSLFTDYAVFSPNGDGRRDVLRFLISEAVTEGIQGWSVEVTDGVGSTRRRFSGTGKPAASLAFDGSDDAGLRLPDSAAYRATLRVTYEKGDKAVATSPSFGIDTTPPLIRLSTDSLLFSPDGDRRKDEVTFYQSGSSEDLWLGSVVNAAGRAVRATSWKGRPLPWTWDGKDSDGKVVPDGEYTYRVGCADAAENAITAELTGIRVDTRPTSVALVASAPVFSPNGDGVRDMVDFDLTVRPADGIRTWYLTVSDRSGEAVRSYSGSTDRSIPSRVSWDGQDYAGAAREGAYTVELIVEHEKGNVARASIPVSTDVSPPRLAVATTPSLFSPDGDGVDDVLSIALEARDDSGIGAWSVRINDPVGQLFAQFSGTGAPRTPLSWNGRSATGELVQSAEDYSLVFSAQDAVGNTGRAEAIIRIDILVLRDGDRLKIVISSIYFKEFTADYRNVPAERAQENIQTLNRLAEKLKKFPQYFIRIEGHAARVYWYDAAKLKIEEQEVLLPLSRQRAEAVKAALVERGVQPERMGTAGYGGTQPVVPHSDLQNQWKNRRVEFILEKR